MKYRPGSILWGLFVIAALLFIAGRVRHGNAVDTSLLSLLPASEGDPLLTEANHLLSGRASHLMAFVIAHPDAKATSEMGQQLKEELRPSEFVHSSLTEPSPDQQKSFYDLYFPLRYQMLSPGDRQRLQGDNPLDYFIGRLTATLYSPASAFLKDLIPQDPLLFFPELVRSWMETSVPRSSLENSDSFAAVELALDPFDAKNQDRMTVWLSDMRQRFLTRWPGSHLYVSGVLPFAMAERLRTEHEMKMVSTGSLIGVLLMAWLVFASLRVLFLAALPIAVGFVVAVAATLLCFGNIHIITFAFGSSLIGVAIDYPLLYLAYYRTSGERWDAQAALGQVAPGLLLGASTTLMGYAALSLAPFPGLRQMALFSSVGLCSALITVLLWLPGMIGPGPAVKEEPRLLIFGRVMLARLQKGWRTGSHKGLAVGLMVVALFIGLGLSKLRFDDDIRRLQNPPASVLEEDAFVRKAMKGFGESRFILIRGTTLEELLQRQEQLQDRLLPLQASGRLSSIQSLAPFLPSLQRQEENRMLLQKSLLAKPGLVRRRFQAVGLYPDLADHLLHDLSQPLQAFSIDAWLASPASQMLRALWVGSTPHGYASAVLVGGLPDPVLLKESIKDLAGVRYFDQVEEYTQLFRRYRHLSLKLILGAYVGVWALMMFRYGPKRGTWVTAPSVGGVLLTFATFGWCGMPVHLIHCISALLVLSMGIDYTIYFAEAARAKRPVGPTLLAVELCAFSALLSFGLLALCRTPVLSAIGMTVFIGMAVAFLLSPLSYVEPVV